MLAQPGGAAGARAAGEPDSDDSPWKERRRLERSRRPARGRAAAQRRGAGRRAGRGVGAAPESPGAATGRPSGASAASRAAGTAGRPSSSANPAKIRQGVVVSDRADKTITVRIDIARRHPAYEKVVRRSRTLHAHDERNEAGEGDIVRVIETRPLSRTKRWRLVEVLEKAR